MLVVIDLTVRRDLLEIDSERHLAHSLENGKHFSSSFLSLFLSPSTLRISRSLVLSLISTDFFSTLKAWGIRFLPVLCERLGSPFDLILLPSNNYFSRVFSGLYFHWFVNDFIFSWLFVFFEFNNYFSAPCRSLPFVSSFISLISHSVRLRILTWVGHLSCVAFRVRFFDFVILHFIVSFCLFRSARVESRTAWLFSYRAAEARLARQAIPPEELTTIQFVHFATLNQYSCVEFDTRWVFIPRSTPLVPIHGEKGGSRRGDESDDLKGV